MSIVEDIAARMAQRFPHAEVEQDASSIAYIPPTAEGFIVRLLVKNPGPEERYLVYYDKSLQPVTDRQSSILDFAFGLSNGCRLRVFSRSGRAYHWITDIDGFSGWKPYWETYNLAGPWWRFWCPGQVRVLQNRLIDLSGGLEGTGGCVVRK